MATISRNRRSQILSAALAVLLSAPQAFAAPAESKGTASASVRDVLKTGDFIAVTPWSGKKVKGRVVEATDCSIRLNAAGKPLIIETAAIKTLRAYPSRNENAGNSMVDAMERCDRIECAPATLAVVGVAAVLRGFRGLGGKAKVVYRGKRDHPAGVSCPENGRSRPSAPQKDMH